MSIWGPRGRNSCWLASPHPPTRGPTRPICAQPSKFKACVVDTGCCTSEEAPPSGPGGATPPPPRTPGGGGEGRGLDVWGHRRHGGPVCGGRRPRPQAGLRRRLGRLLPAGRAAPAAGRAAVAQRGQRRRLRPAARRVLVEQRQEERRRAALRPGSESFRPPISKQEIPRTVQAHDTAPKLSKCSKLRTKSQQLCDATLIVRELSNLQTTPHDSPTAPGTPRTYTNP